MTNQKEHWENVYKSKQADEVSWFQLHLSKSLELISQSGIDPEARIIDVGGGASTLVDDLLAQKYEHITVLDLSSKALEKAKQRLGKLADKVNWVEADISKASFPVHDFDLWHDRAVFHFLTEQEKRRSYRNVLTEALKPGGFVIMATFSLEGPLKCSGLEVARYSPDTLSKELGERFSLIKSGSERHQTPFNTFQEFNYCLFKRI